MNRREQLLTEIRALQGNCEADLFSGLYNSLGEDHAVIQDAVEGGQRAFYALLETIQDKLCSSATITQIRQDFNQSGPIVAALLLTEEALKNGLNYEAQVYLGALILKLGIDRICETKGR